MTHKRPAELTGRFVSAVSVSGVVLPRFARSIAGYRTLCEMTGEANYPSRAVTGWQTLERVLESGGFESRQRVLVAEPVVEASEAGARTLGVSYWQAVDRFTRGGVRASWRGGGGKLKLLGGATLLTFGPPELSFDGGLVRCRHAIEGGLLALRAGGSVTLAQRPEGDQQELSVTVEEYLPRLAARAGAPLWTGMLYAKAQSPFHVAVSRRYFELLLRSRDS